MSSDCSVWTLVRPIVGQSRVSNASQLRLVDESSKPVGSYHHSRLLGEALAYQIEAMKWRVTWARNLRVHKAADIQTYYAATTLSIMAFIFYELGMLLGLL
jgi:hypothetical protein